MSKRFTMRVRFEYLGKLRECCHISSNVLLIIFCRSRNLGVTNTVVTSINSIVKRGYFITVTQFAVNRNSDHVVMEFPAAWC
jgi:hypothetical protein